MNSRGWPPDVESRLALGGLLEVLRPAPHRKDMLLLEIKFYF